MPKRYTPEEKAQILARASEIGAAAAAREAGVSYNGILKWIHAAKSSTNSVTDMVKDGVEKMAAHPGEMVERLNAQIEIKEEEIRGLEESLKARKAELKELQKAGSKAEKEKELFDAAEQKKQLVEAVMKSGKSVEEIMGFLNS